MENDEQSFGEQAGNEQDRQRYQDLSADAQDQTAGPQSPADSFDDSLREQLQPYAEKNDLSENETDEDIAA